MKVVQAERSKSGNDRRILNHTTIQEHRALMEAVNELSFQQAAVGVQSYHTLMKLTP